MFLKIYICIELHHVKKLICIISLHAGLFCVLFCHLQIFFYSEFF